MRGDWCHRWFGTCATLAPGKCEDVRTSLALAIEISPAYLIDERVDQRTNPSRDSAKDADLPVVRRDDVLQRCPDCRR